MRLLSLTIAIAVLFGVAYVSFSTPSRAAIFGGEMKTASNAPSR